MLGVGGIDTWRVTLLAAVRRLLLLSNTLVAAPVPQYTRQSI
jgi:hypothetical protein